MTSTSLRFSALSAHKIITAWDDQSIFAFTWATAYGSPLYSAPLITSGVALTLMTDSCVKPWEGDVCNQSAKIQSDFKYQKAVSGFQSMLKIAACVA